MPIYVYKGLETGNYYEFEQGFHDEPLKAHPETGERLKRRQEGRGFGHQQAQ